MSAYVVLHATSGGLIEVPIADSLELRDPE